MEVTTLFQIAGNEKVKVEVDPDGLEYHVEKKLKRSMRQRQTGKHRHGTSDPQGPPHKMITKPKRKMIKFVFEQPLVQYRV
jgi:hypothetical protein